MKVLKRQELTTYENNWSVSVITGKDTYSDEGTFEVAVITPAGITKEPQAYCTPRRVEEIKERVAAFTKLFFEIEEWTEEWISNCP